MKQLLIEIINDNKLSIKIVDTKNVKRTTSSLANDVIRYYGTKPKGVSVQTLKPTKTNLGFDVSSPINGNTLIIIPCSDDKISGGNEDLNTDYFDASSQNPISNFRTTRNEILNQFGPTSPESKYLLEAYQRYSGHIYKAINWQSIHQKVDIGCLKVVIVSALFGLLEYKRKIPEYDLEISKTRVLWRPSIQDAIDHYIADNAIENVYSFLAVEYAQLMPQIDSIPRRPGCNQYYVGDWVNKVVRNVNCKPD